MLVGNLDLQSIIGNEEVTQEWEGTKVVQCNTIMIVSSRGNQVRVVRVGPQMTRAGREESDGNARGRDKSSLYERNNLYMSYRIDNQTR